MQTVRRLGLWDRVEVPGPTTDLASEWARASISAMTSRSEGFPLVMQEAMAAGVPVVSYDSPSGPRAIIDDGVDGLLVAQDSEPAMAAALLRLATDHELRYRLGAAALRKASDFDSAAIAARWVRIYEEAVRCKRAGGQRAGEQRAAPPVPQDEAPAGAEGHGVTRDAATAAAVAAAVAAGAEVVGTRGVVPMDRRREFLDALVEADVPAYLSLHDPETGGWPSRRAPVADLVPHLRRGRTTRVLLEPWPLVGGRPSALAGSGVVVEFVDAEVTG
jgi:hypothetical protein